MNRLSSYFLLLIFINSSLNVSKNFLIFFDEALYLISHPILPPKKKMLWIVILINCNIGTGDLDQNFWDKIREILGSFPEHTLLPFLI